MMKRRLAAALIVVGTIAYFAAVHHFSEPAPTRAEDPVTTPAVSIVFVIDSSRSMIPPIGPTYFDLARDGIVQFLKKPGLFADGTYEVAVIQYTQSGAPGYFAAMLGGSGPVHWIGPTRIDSEETKSWLIGAVARMERSGHFSASLMESGLLGASRLLDISVPEVDRLTAAGPNTERHIILLSTGEYRLPPPCPTNDYTDELHENDDWSCLEIECVNFTGGELTYCNRACLIRAAAAAAPGSGIRLSTLRVGSDWKYDPLTPTAACAEQAYPYGDPPAYCQMPVRPDRDGFLKELANWGALSDGERQACVGTEAVLGQNARIAPFYCFGTNTSACNPGTSRDIADTIANWLCGWWKTDPLVWGKWNLDMDFADAAETQKPLFDLCDNCPSDPNPHQRDCNENGIGDMCETIEMGGAWDHIEGCGPATADEDCDGVPDSHDTCSGGDDCLVAYWAKTGPCKPDDDPNTCDCDCNHDCVLDACNGAKIYGLATLPDPNEDWNWYWGWSDTNYNGIADLCDTEERCKPFAAFCDPDESAHAESFAYDVDQAFDDIEFSDSLDEYGWYLSHSCAGNAATIVTEGSEKYLRLAPASECTGPDQPSSWYVESPGKVLPGYRCAPSGCATPAITRWGIYAAEIDLRINNDPNAPNIDLYLVDPYEQVWEAAKRVHVRFVGAGPELQGPIWSQTYCNSGTPDVGDGFYHIGDYKRDEWVKYVFLFNMSQHFDANTCVFDPEAKVLKMQNFFSFGGSYGFCLVNDQKELGATVPTRPRGIQFVIESHDVGPSNASVDIDNVVIRPATQCEWGDPTDPECASGSMCQCGVGGGWQCLAAPATCDIDANGALDGQCFLPDGVSCSQECEWVCGDGYAQTPQRIYGPGLDENGNVYDHFTCTFLGMEHCEHGSEECDFVGLDENGCSCVGCALDCPDP